MRNPLLRLTALTAEAVANSQPQENGIRWPGCFAWSYEPKMPASMLKGADCEVRSDKPAAD